MVIVVVAAGDVVAVAAAPPRQTPALPGTPPRTSPIRAFVGERTPPRPSPCSSWAIRYSRRLRPNKCRKEAVVGKWTAPQLRQKSKRRWRCCCSSCCVATVGVHVFSLFLYNKLDGKALEDCCVGQQAATARRKRTTVVRGFSKGESQR